MERRLHHYFIYKTHSAARRQNENGLAAAAEVPSSCSRLGAAELMVQQQQILQRGPAQKALISRSAGRTGKEQNASSALGFHRTYGPVRRFSSLNETRAAEIHIRHRTIHIPRSACTRAGARARASSALGPHRLPPSRRFSVENFCASSFLKL